MSFKLAFSKDPYFDLLKTSKSSLNRIIRRPLKINKKTYTCPVQPILQDAVFRMNKIVIRTYNFLKAYILYLTDRDDDLPTIDENFIAIIMRLVSVQKANEQRSSNANEEIAKPLRAFYKNYYSKTIDPKDIVARDLLGNMLNYEATDIITSLQNNIKQHYTQHVNKYINARFKLKERCKAVSHLSERAQLQYEMRRELRLLKDEILNVTNKVTGYDDAKYGGWIEHNKYELIPYKKSYAKDSVHYDVCVTPNDYIKSMIKINQKLAKLNSEVKLFHSLPLRTEFTPKYVTFDTATILTLLDYKNKAKLRKHIVKYKLVIWNKYFDILYTTQSNEIATRQEFKKTGYVFSGMIKTDGVGCSILFKKVDAKGTEIKATGSQLRQVQANVEKQDREYIETQDVKTLLKDKAVVPLDPNVADQIHAANEHVMFRYTQQQRIYETKSKHHARIIDHISKFTKINSKTMKEYEASIPDAKTCDFNKFMKYLKAKNEANKALSSQYQKKLYRKLRWNRFINTQKSEDKMINNFHAKFGVRRDGDSNVTEVLPPEKVVVVIGDYSKNHGNKTMKGTMPAVTKRIRTLFRRRKYPVLLIDEFRTSKLCNKCESEVEKFHWRPSQKPKNKGKMILVHGLVRCKNVNCKPEVTEKNLKYANNLDFRSTYNRDTNACLNMVKIIESLRDTGERPLAYKR